MIKMRSASASHSNPDYFSDKKKQAFEPLSRLHENGGYGKVRTQIGAVGSNWQEIFSAARRKYGIADGIQFRHFIIAPKAGTSIIQLVESVRDFVAHNFRNADTVAFFHKDKPGRFDCHLLVNNIDYDTVGKTGSRGRPLKPKKINVVKYDKGQTGTRTISYPKIVNSYYDLAKKNGVLEDFDGYSRISYSDALVKKKVAGEKIEWIKKGARSNRNQSLSYSKNRANDVKDEVRRLLDERVASGSDLLALDSNLEIKQRSKDSDTFTAHYTDENGKAYRFRLPKLGEEYSINRLRARQSDFMKEKVAQEVKAHNERLKDVYAPKKAEPSSFKWPQIEYPDEKGKDDNAFYAISFDKNGNRVETRIDRDSSDDANYFDDAFGG